MMFGKNSTAAMLTDQKAGKKRKIEKLRMVELSGIEPLTSSLRTTRSPN